MEWKIIYVGSADSEEYDQELDSVLVGPVSQGAMKFVFSVCGMSSNTKWGQTALRSDHFFFFTWPSSSTPPSSKAEPPNPAKIPETELVGVTVVLLTCSYRNQEFIRVGYYVNVEYSDPEL